MAKTAKPRVDQCLLEGKDWEIRDCENGKGRGVFAKRQFRPGEIVLRVTGQVITDADYESLYCIELSDGARLEPYLPGAAVNHSCDPNCQLMECSTHELILEAIVNIQPGREISFDYGWPADIGPQACHCGSVKCRKYIVDIDELTKLERSLEKQTERIKKRKESENAKEPRVELATTVRLALKENRFDKKRSRHRAQPMGQNGRVRGKLRRGGDKS
jgi:uncharacterized protein